MIGSTLAIDSPRWQEYVLTSGSEYDAFWAERLQQQRDVLFVLGRGFNPRTCLGLASLLGVGGRGRRDVLVLALKEGLLSPSQVHASLAAANWAEVQRLVGSGSLKEQIVQIWSDDGRRRVGASRAASIFKAISDIAAYSEVVIDISALPRGIYFPLIAKLLYLLDKEKSRGALHLPNLHVIVSEAPELDRRIHDEGVEEKAEYLRYFQGGAKVQGDNSLPMIWIPLLGEGQQTQLENISELVGQAEVCPVLPSPARNPRRGDNLVMEYRSFLFDQLRIEPRNIIFASEWNPFEVYRQIRRTILDYRIALAPLGGCKPVLSALSTKLMSLGALLVAYELKENGIGVAVAHVESHGYAMDMPSPQIPYGGSKLYGLWLWGECYEA